MKAGKDNRSWIIENMMSLECRFLSI